MFMTINIYNKEVESLRLKFHL